MITLKLVPKVIPILQTRLHYNIIGVTDTTAGVYYRLTEDDGWLIQEGNESIPIGTLAVLASGNIQAINQVLAGFNIQALEDQSDPEPSL